MTPLKILFVLTSHAQLGNTDHTTGFWLEEFTTPYYAFLDGGAEITLASPKGGQPPVDPRSQEEPVPNPHPDHPGLHIITASCEMTSWLIACIWRRKCRDVAHRLSSCAQFRNCAEMRLANNC